MRPTASFNAANLAKSLLRCRREGALATLTAGSSDPYCSLVNLASHWDGSPILLISRLALHTRNLLADPRVSLMLDERRRGDPLEGARIMLAGRAVQAGENERPALRRRYLAAHPSAETFVDFPDFSFFRIVPNGAHLVAGFGRIVDLKPEAFLTDLSGAEALLDHEDDIVAHMNADHQGTMNLYATALVGAEEAAWRCTGCDPDGLDMTDERGSSVRLPFPDRVATPSALRKMLKDLADQARAQQPN